MSPPQFWIDNNRNQPTAEKKKRRENACFSISFSTIDEWPWNDRWRYGSQNTPKRVHLLSCTGMLGNFSTEPGIEPRIWKNIYKWCYWQSCKYYRSGNQTYVSPMYNTFISPPAGSIEIAFGSSINSAFEKENQISSKMTKSSGIFANISAESPEESQTLYTTITGGLVDVATDNLAKKSQTAALNQSQNSKQYLSFKEATRISFTRISFTRIRFNVTPENNFLKISRQCRWLNYSATSKS